MTKERFTTPPQMHGERNTTYFYLRDLTEEEQDDCIIYALHQGGLFEYFVGYEVSGLHRGKYRDYLFTHTKQAREQRPELFCGPDPRLEEEKSSAGVGMCATLSTEDAELLKKIWRLYALGEHEKLCTMLEKRLSYGPDVLQILEHAVHCFLCLDRLPEGVDAFERGVEVNPKKPCYVYDVLSAVYCLQDRARYFRIIERIVERNKDAWEGWLEYAPAMWNALCEAFPTHDYSKIRSLSAYESLSLRVKANVPPRLANEARLLRFH